MRTVLMAFGVVLALGATAQDAEPETGSGKTPTASETSTPANDNKTTDRSQSTPYFEPSEEISEDLSVSFPVDI